MVVPSPLGSWSAWPCMKVLDPSELCWLFTIWYSDMPPVESPGRRWKWDFPHPSRPALGSTTMSSAPFPGVQRPQRVVLRYHVIKTDFSLRRCSITTKKKNRQLGKVTKNLCFSFVVLFDAQFSVGVARTITYRENVVTSLFISISLNYAIYTRRR